MVGFLEWLASRDDQLLVESVLLESRDVDIIRTQINSMFEDALQTLLKAGKITTHADEARQLVNRGFDWWAGLMRVMKQYPYKGQDLYDAAVTLAGDLWENVFNPNKYSDRYPPLAIFHKMALLRGQDIAFRFFGWRRKMKSSTYSDLGYEGDLSIADTKDSTSDLEWQDLQDKLIAAIGKEADNPERVRRAVDVIHVKLDGRSKLYNKTVTDTGLDSLSRFYHVNRREMYDTLLLVYRAVRDIAKEMANEDETDYFFQRVLGQLPTSLTRDPEEMILSLIPPPPEEISHSELFTKAYSNNRGLKSLSFRQIIQNLLDRKKIDTRRDSRAGKHQVLYRLISA